MTLRDAGAAPRVVQVGLDCVPSSGGTTTAMHDFRRALDAPIISFTRAQCIGEAQEADDSVHHIPVRGALRTAYHWPTLRDGQAAAAVAADADLLIIHGVFQHHAGWGAVQARRLGIPHWVVPHGFLDPWTLSYRRARKRIWLSLVGTGLFRGADRAIFATRREFEKAGSHFGSAKSTVVHWPVEMQPSAAGARVRLRSALGVGDDERVLLMLGRLHPSKGVLEAMRAVAESRHESLHLVVVGPDSSELTRTECQQLAADLAPGRIHVRGPLFGTDKVEMLAAADGFLNLSGRENFGYAVAEAAAAGLPVILSPGNDLGPELASAGGGWVLKSSVEAPAALRTFATADAAVLRSLGVAARRWAERELSFEKFRNTLQELTKESIARHARVR